MPRVVIEFGEDGAIHRIEASERSASGTPIAAALADGDRAIDASQLPAGAVPLVAWSIEQLRRARREHVRRALVEQLGVPAEMVDDLIGALKKQ